MKYAFTLALVIRGAIVKTESASFYTYKEAEETVNSKNKNLKGMAWKILDYDRNVFKEE